jgi:hypothetical protein
MQTLWAGDSEQRRGGRQRRVSCLMIEVESLELGSFVYAAVAGIEVM